MTMLRSGMERSIVTRLLRPADIRIDGDRAWDIHVIDERFFMRLLTRGSLGFGESYMAGWWHTQDLEQLAYRVSKARLHWLGRLIPAHLFSFLTAALANQQAPAKSLIVADRHYNLGNDLFFSFLGEYKNYSCGYFDGTESLDQAQAMKMSLVCQKLKLSESDRLLDIGGGWGQFAHFAAMNYGCTVTSINIADEQIRYARELCQGLPVEVVKCDYRALSQRYNKIAVIAMLTHVGPKNYRRFMQITHDCLDEEGIVLIESVGSRFSRINCEPWVDKYIFPGGVVPSLRQIDNAIKGLFVRTQLEEFGHYYVPTLHSWHTNLSATWPSLAARYPETIRLMLEYFFLTVAGGFRAGDLKHWHIVLQKATPGQLQ